MKRKFLKYITFTVISFCAGLAGAFTFSHSGNSQPEEENFVTTRATPVRLPGNLPAGLDFVKAAEQSKGSVVYIKVLATATQNMGWDPFFDLFGNAGPVSSSGSGVIITSDGYIVTNHHVVQNAQKIEVVLNNNKRSYIGTIIGMDPSTDLALIKIEAKNLQPVNFTNSDNLLVGQWVLAVGNPFNLTSSVTAGIVSAKGRNINIVHNKFPIESFIQTDAAINPGNSGGALVNQDGDLVGINTAILSQTGSYAGYGFAIPANIVKKVVNDIKEFGYVQRAFLEADITDIDDKLATKLDYNDYNGVYVRIVVPDGNAEHSGMKSGDILTKVDGKFVDSRSGFDEQLAYHRPGDKVTFSLLRGKSLKEVSVTLTNMRGTTSLEKNKSIKSQTLGAEFEEITKIEKEKYNVQSGYRIFNLTNGTIRRMNLPEGFIITGFNNRVYENANELIQAMENANGRIIIEGINPNGTKATYQFFSY